MAEFKDRLKEMRMARGMTQAKFGDFLGINHSVISAMESGRTKPSYSTSVRIANKLGVSYDYLFGRDDVSIFSDDEDVVKCLEYARDNPNIRMLFSVTKDATKEDIETAVDIIKALRGET